MKEDLLSLFFEQLGSLLSTGVGLNSSLAVLKDELKNKRLRSITGDIKNDIGNGIQLSESIGKHTNFLSPMYLKMIKAGEETGTLPEVLKQVSIILNKNALVKSKVSNLLIYPALVILVDFFIMLFMFFSSVPTLKQVYSNPYLSKNISAPFLTKVMFFFHVILHDYWFISLPVILILVIGSIIFLMTEKGYHFKNKLFLKLPFINKIIISNELSRTSSILGLLVKNGIPLKDAMELVNDTSLNQEFKAIFSKVPGQLEEGSDFSESLEDLDQRYLIPSTFTGLIKSAEKNGNLVENLGILSDYYDLKNESLMKVFYRYFEPVSIIVLGVFIGLIIISLFTPILQMAILISE